MTSPQTPSPLPLPPEDRTRSPLTGWTRDHWEALADRLLDAVVPYATPGFAQYRLPGRTSWAGEVSDGLEGYARSFLLAAFRIAGAGRAGGPVDPRLVERYTEGLISGTDPDGPEAWPALTDRSQQMVEAASVAVALHETRPWIWDRLDTRARERVVDWLSGFVGRHTWDTNWRLFQVISEQFLASVGAPHNRGEIEDGLDRLEEWYVGDGWYSDGTGRNFDYYNAWAMHFYPLLWARMADPEGTGAAGTGGDGTRAAGTGADGGRAKVYRERLGLFLATYPHFFGGDGAPVHQGRSLTYRFAATAPVWMGALTGCTPLAPGLTRRLGSGAARHFAERGAPDERGLMPLGWYGTFLPATQPYSGPASPYWVSKGFLGLLLPPDHPVWTEPELPLPVEKSDQYTALPAPGWLLHGTARDGIVRLVNHGSDLNWPGTEATDDPHYAKFGYSTATAPDTSPEARARNVGNHLALIGPDGTPSRRVSIQPLRCEGRRAASRHDARLPGGDETYPIETTSVLHGPWELRVHRVTAPEGVTVREGGYAVAGEVPPDAGEGPGWALARSASGLTSTVIALHGWDEGEDENGSGVSGETGANAYGTHSATPYLRRSGHPGGTGLYVTLVALAGGPTAPAALAGPADCAALRASLSCAVADGEVRVTFPDGTGITV
ncbi:DUF2264 domain-containing protein [Streptomyces sp. LP05-1]|uniref:DUF2264 domain-containing protein n=1 Tax=Streptomyces pyxinae TaxID=2970734 RepID=A0ABT2CK10_9ACTN|nr:DUF2264 domain-containing protein [Streptomyces sp. LP05-1]MCS0637749.1 DUF2264 domain-containing protein [Streptomyces sp. LP05-1]